MKYVYVKRIEDGMDFGTVDIPEEHLAETLIVHPEWQVITPKTIEEEIISPPTPVKKYECPICGREFKNAGGVALHKQTHK